MITESQKEEIRKMLTERGEEIIVKRQTHHNLRERGEDTVSAFMGEGEVPEPFNDSGLNDRYTMLGFYEKKLDTLKESWDEIIARNDFLGINQIKSSLSELKFQIEKV